ncbi:type II toxin-antitoxin system RelE family toxin [Streptomyces benahoarensis]|uniref:Type II toxin-antitoxin system RelE/ParE family toxin n=1 Tax=Streptomyces benahoarensis TaxID=2595054 RepID=A0A553ZL23_9ACTN|nr:type II toxin-antitoxin system RelE/ParE family toxin [Streptomyces benahoarensis]TSB25813.1 type II toxin-antitoxin system RelE/ParE family toxin [Streptomyces benahoarensis]TSB42115.1 type II toxin-antitoxin system RelE/ParE family toxin [Streptomyces benahoarensis]
MKYVFRFTTAAQRQLRALDRPTTMRILAALTELGDDPYRADADIKKLTGPSGLYRLRLGNHRIAYRIEDGELVILVIEVGERRDVYRAL